MRVSNRILLSTTASLAISAIILLGVYSILWEIKDEGERAGLYGQIEHQTTALNLLAAGLPSQPDPSRVRQIKTVHTSLENILAQMSAYNTREAAFIHQIQNNARALGKSIEKLLSSTDIKTDAASGLREVLVSQLWMKTQLISDDTNRLMKISQMRIDAAQQQAAILILVLIAALILINAAISLFSGRRILRVQKSLHDALTEAEQKSRILEAMMEHIPMGITIADSLDVRVKFISRYGLEMIGRPGHGSEVRSLETHGRWPFFSADGVTPARDEALPLTRAIKHGELIEQEEWVMARPDGSRIPVLCTAAPIRDAQGGIIGGVIGWQDITHRKQVEEALRQLNDTLERKVADRTRLAEARANQLQSLAVELIDAEERERQRISALLHDDLQQILAAARFRLQTIQKNLTGWSELPDVEEMLASAMDKARRLSHELSPAMLNHSGLVPSLEWLSRHMRERFGLEVKIQAEKVQELESVPLKIFIFRAVQELLFNVVKYAGVKQAQVSLRGCDQGFSVTVSDRGKGFEHTILEQSDPRTGLGLLSLRERANYIGGSLKIDSASNQGSQISITVPVSLVRETPKPPAIQAASDSAAVRPAKAPHIRVMFVDDHMVMRQGLIRLISNQPDIQVVGEAGNGQEALALARQLKPDVVVMDVSLPEMNGIEATRRLKIDFPEMCVIGLSMFEDEQTALSMREAGAAAFMSKAASAAHLLQVIYGCIRDSEPS